VSDPTGSPGRFAGRVALVTGAASGIGRAVALRLAAEGATVVAHDRDAAGLAATAASAASAASAAEGGAAGGFLTRVGDLASRDECVAAVADAATRGGRLDVLANVAGLARADHVTDVDEATYRRLCAVNQDAPFFLCQAAIPHLLTTGGNIVNLASNSGLMGGAYTVAYCMTKGAVVQLTRALAMEYLKTGLRVNAVAPGATDTALPASFHVPDGVDGELMARYMVPRPMSAAEEIAGLVAFVASDEGRSIHGAILSIDNGVTAG
jgi:NAD(P)-dependent dehydrogenase (short-subunit alcohol dehydrogenase family)